MIGCAALRTSGVSSGAGTALAEGSSSSWRRATSSGVRGSAWLSGGELGPRSRGTERNGSSERRSAAAALQLRQDSTWSWWQTMTSLAEGSARSSPSGRPGEHGSRDEARPRPGARLLIALVEAYRLVLSPLIGGFCRFTPSCSLYAQEALLRHGALGGLALAVRRLLRCHPFNPGGFDPVP